MVDVDDDPRSDEERASDSEADEDKDGECGRVSRRRLDEFDDDGALSDGDIPEEDR